MSEAEKFCLKWNDFETNLSRAFSELREEKDFFDVTLVCEDNQLDAHKVILSACSPFFRNILKKNPHKHPLLYLKDVRWEDMQSILTFMYQVNSTVLQSLGNFLFVRGGSLWRWLINYLNLYYFSVRLNYNRFWAERCGSDMLRAVRCGHKSYFNQAHYGEGGG